MTDQTIPHDLHELTLAQASRLISQKKVSPVELVQSLLVRIERFDGTVHAITTLTADSCMAQAREAETAIMAGRWRGPLHGIPFLLKDIIDTRDILTAACSRICADNYPLEDAYVVRRLYDAGALLLGKATTHEFAHGGPSFDLPWPPARNPWNTNHYSGGSSSGSAAAVAAGFAPLALGSDTGGSIRIPAALCGVVGLKPTYGLVSRRGIIPNSYSLDTCGPLTWTVEDAAIALGVIAGYDPQSPGSLDVEVPPYAECLDPSLSGIRIGVLRHFWENDHPVAQPVADAIEAALDVMRGLGATAETARMRPLQEYSDVKVVVAESELLSIHQQDFMARPADFGQIFAGRVLGACLFQAVDYVNAQRERRHMVEQMKSVFERFDVLVTVGPGPAPQLVRHNALAEKWEKPSLTAPFNVTGNPAIAVCMGYTPDGLPLSLQVAGRHLDEAMVLRVAYAYEKATNWRARRPEIVFGRAKPDVPAVSPPCLISAQVDDEQFKIWADAAARAGLKLPEHMLTQLIAAAPHAAAMAERLRRPRQRSEEPASVFVRSS